VTLPLNSMRTRDELRPEIVVNVYKTHPNSNFSFPGLIGAYHSGVVLSGVEYSFANSVGVYETRPGEYGRVVRSMSLGIATKTNREILEILNKLRTRFPGDSYDLLTQNCNHFSDCFIRSISEAKLPAWVNRAAWWGSWVRCCIPSATDQQPLVSRAAVSPPVFAGEGLRLSTSRPVTKEEERELRIRKFQ
jgi:hypothetical protein